MSPIRKSRFVPLVATVAAFLFAFVLFNATARPALAHGDAVPGQYIIVLNDTESAAAVATDLANSYGFRILHVYDAALNGFAAARVSVNNLDALSRDGRIRYIEPDRYVSLDPSLVVDAGIDAPEAQTIPTGILRVDGELSSTVSGNGSGSVNVDVAILDTGIQTNHPDLTVVGGVNCSSGNSYSDGHGHGTHVAGTVAAKDDGNGVVGVAPGARLWAVRVLNNQGSGTTSTIICGINWVKNNASTIEVANMSLGGSGSDSSCGGSDSYHNAICSAVGAGVTFVVAAGNSYANANNYRPATYAEVITVSALADFNGNPGGGAPQTCRVDVDDTFADFSNYGSDVDMIAPGVCILSTYRNSSYATMSGTSMASPHVAGAAALYKANNPSATPAQIKSAIQNAGNLNWNQTGDPDGIKEKLLNVDTF
jgi:subtilisin family serine protease